MKHLLITGFDPFGGETVNPSWEAVRRLPDAVGQYRLTKLQIPTVFAAAADAVLAAAKADRPDVILCIGQAGGRDAVTPERIAVNIRDARIPDNEGIRYSGEKVCEDGPAAYFSTLPVEKMAQAIRNIGIPAAVSNTAGTFVCNDVLYTVLHRTDLPACFIHVPYLPEQGHPNLPLETTVAALTAAIRSL